MNQNTKTILACLVALLGTGLFVWLVPPVFRAGVATPAVVVDEPNDEQGTLPPSDMATTTPTTTPPTAVTKPGASNKPLTYADAVKKYAGVRFQFANNCTQTTPSSFVIKLGSKFMIDNREGKAHTFNFAGQNYYLKSFGYTLVTPYKIGVQKVSCDGIQRVTVNVQK